MNMQLKPLPRHVQERLRREYWERHANNKTYEQWQVEQAVATNRVHQMMDAIEGMINA